MTIRGWEIATGALFSVALALAFCAPASAQVQPSVEERERLRTWVPASCCVTSDALPAGTGCCFEIAPTEVEALSGGRWRVKATGQVVSASPSRDGRWWRCACDQVEGRWVVWRGADTRCLFVFQGL